LFLFPNQIDHGFSHGLADQPIRFAVVVPVVVLHSVRRQFVAIEISAFDAGYGDVGPSLIAVPPFHPRHADRYQEVRDSQVDPNVPNEVRQIGLVLCRRFYPAAVVPSLVPGESHQLVATIGSVSRNEFREIRQCLVKVGQHGPVVQSGRADSIPAGKVACRLYVIITSSRAFQETASPMCSS
jgi:hypothetical protein